MSVAVEFRPAETWLLEGRLETILEAVRFETDHVVVAESGGEALLESTEVSDTRAHVAVLHRRSSVGGVPTPADDGTDPVRASFQHDSSPRTYSVQKALAPFRRATIER